MKQLRYTKQR